MNILILFVSVGFPLIALFGFIFLAILLGSIIDEWFEMLFRRED